MFTGLSAFPLTPADDRGEVDHAGLRRLIDRLAAAGVDSIGLLGSTGTYAYLTRSQRRAALETARVEGAGRVPILVGIGALRTDEAVCLAQDAKAAGASAGLLAPVSYTPLGDDEVFEHFAAVARGSGLPICIYDNPSTTHFRFSPALIGRLASVDGIVAVKSPTGPPIDIAIHLADLRKRVPSAFSLGYSGDWNAAEALLAGADAWYSVAGGLFPTDCLALTRAAQAGDAERTDELNTRLEPLWALFRAHSSLRVMYAAADILGVCRAEPPRPILPLTEAARREVETVLSDLALR